MNCLLILTACVLTDTGHNCALKNMHVNKGKRIVEASRLDLVEDDDGKHARLNFREGYPSYLYVMESAANVLNQIKRCNRK